MSTCPQQLLADLFPFPTFGTVEVKPSAVVDVDIPDGAACSRVVRAAVAVLQINLSQEAWPHRSWSLPGPPCCGQGAGEPRLAGS